MKILLILLLSQQSEILLFVLLDWKSCNFSTAIRKLSVLLTDGTQNTFFFSIQPIRFKGKYQDKKILCRLYSMLYALRLFTTLTWIVCLPHQYETWHFMQSFIRLNHHSGWIAWPRYGSIRRKCLSQGNSDAIHCQFNNQIESTSLRLPICVLIHWATVLLVTPARCAQCGHRTSNRTITILRS